MQELRGKPVADAITEELIKRTDALKSKGIDPTLAIVRVGERPDDLSYQRGAVSRSEKVGVTPKVYAFEGGISEEDFIAEFKKIADDASVHGILLLHPLPKHIDIEKVKSVFPAEKDIDCMLDTNLGRIFTGDRQVPPPCTAQAVMEMLHFYGIKLSGKNVTVCGRSMVVGKPLSQLLLNENATVTVCHSRTVNMASVTASSDIVVTAIGRAKMFKEEYFSEGQTVIDVGINVDENNNLCGDVDYENVKEKVSAITPVPGGVGSVTTAVLLKNLVSAAERRA